MRGHPAPGLGVPSPAEEYGVTAQRCSFAGRDQIYFLPKEHPSNPNVNLSLSLLLEEPHYLFSLRFADLWVNLVLRSTGRVAT